MVTVEMTVPLPADAIRQKDFCEKYSISPERLAKWIHRGYIKNYPVSHKLRFVSESEALAVLKEHSSES